MILAKKASLRKKRVQIVTDNPKHFKLPKEIKRELMEHVTAWLRVDEHSPYNYEVVDGVFRLAGTGSVGIERYAFLLKSLNKTGFKFILLDMKEATPSSLAPHIAARQPAWRSEADRVISAQRRMQNRCPALLSTTTFRGKSFIMQEMQPVKDSIDFLTASPTGTGICTASSTQHGDAHWHQLQLHAVRVWSRRTELTDELKAF